MAVGGRIGAMAKSGSASAPPLRRDKRSASAPSALRRDRPTALPAEAVDADRVLAFVNTLSGRPTAAPAERLVSYDALVAWAREQHLVSAAAGERLSAAARRHPQQAASVLARAREFREALNALAVAIEHERQPAPAVLATIGDCLAAAYAHGRLVPHEGGLQWIASAEDDLDRILWEIGRATGRLVGSPRLGRIRSCAAGDCGWWFVDETKNHSRRWCDMKICGNREKIRRFRSRQ
jgi:predicted RNA-binding Zn ribbon-like protein